MVKYMSIWNKKTKKRNITKLDKDIDTDILIIGAGLTGLNTAYFLKDKNITIVDANVIGHGVTLNSTAKINYFQERIYTKIKDSVGIYKAKLYLISQKYGMNLLKEIIEKERIKCDLEKVPSYVFASTKKEINNLEKEVTFLKDNDISVEESKLPLKIPSYKSYKVLDTYIFNPIKYLESMYNILIKRNINIYEKSKVTRIEKEKDYYICKCNNHKIKANKIVFACHYPYFIYPFFLPLKAYIEKSYIIVSKVKEYKKFTCISSSYPTYSCRFYKDGEDIYQISLGESHDTNYKQKDIYHFNKVKEIFKIKEKDIIESYSNVDLITPDHMPYIGKINDNMYIGTGYNTWGMTNSVLGAKIISDIILEKENKFTSIFNPNRINLKIILMSLIIAYGELKSFLGTKINKNKKWYNQNIKIYKKNGKTIACYIDESGKEHKIYNKCPHLGCSLIFNEEEKTWDCPCHSSRFNIDGECIKGPSNYDIKYKE